MIEGKLTDTRNILLIQMLRGTGVRVSELLRLTPSSVSRDGPNVSVAIKRGKWRGKKAGAYEWVPLQPMSGTSLMRFIESNHIPPDSLIFNVSRMQAYRIIASAGIRAIGRKVGPHELRHLYLKELIDGGLNIEAVAAMVGHSDIRTTMRHYYELTADQRAQIQSRIQV